MDREVLVLNSDYEPLHVCNVRRALALVHLGKAEVLHHDGRVIRSSEGEWTSPSVLKLRHHVRRPLPQLRLSRRSVFARDDYQCQYCGLAGRELTIDHVVPKRLGGAATWENLVTCCRRCNSKKGDKMLEKSGLRLRKEPRRPRFIPYISLAKYVAGRKNQVWREYLPPMPGLSD
ncbi:MAG: HNH endonuclease [Armatimonadetes bacterium]|nr:HNH endonuclease [Armatimonadota bacterium]